MYKKFLSVILSAYLVVVGMFGFVACGNIDKPSGTDNEPETQVQTYYAYDAQTKEYDDDDYMTVADTAVVWYSKDVGFSNMLEFSGTVTFTGKKFTMSLNGSFSVLDTCVVTYRGERETDNVWRIDSMVIATYSEFVDEPVVVTDNEVRYYCQKGSAPENPVLPVEPKPEPEPEPEPEPKTYTVTIDANGGTLKGASSVQTDKDGHAVIDTTAERSGYIFRGYNLKVDGTGATVNSSTVFTDDTTVYAVWGKEITVTFRADNKTFYTKKLGYGDMLGDYRIPKSDGEYFLGWFCHDVLYTSYTEVYDDITLTAGWRPYGTWEALIKDYMQSTSPDTWKEGHLYVHYWRLDHDANEEGTKNIAVPPYYNAHLSDTVVYMDWGLWAWSDGVGVGRLFNIAWIDFSGAVYDIDCTCTFTDCGWDGAKKEPLNEQNKFDTTRIGTQLVKLSSMKNDGFWANDGGNNYYNRTKYNHVFLTQNSVSHPIFYNSFTDELKSA